jgi:hypothetical protein
MGLRTGVRLGLAAVLGSGLMVVGNPSPSSAAPDTTPPNLNVQPAQFIRGAQIGASFGPPADHSYSSPTFNIPMYTTWTGSDASFICGYDVLAVDQFGNAEPTGFANTFRVRFDGDTTDDVPETLPVLQAWRVIANDCAENFTARDVRVTPTVTQENGTDLFGLPSAVRISYRGTWVATSPCACSARAARRTTSPGASAVINFSTRIANSPIGIVMPKGPGRGKFTVYLDGVNKGTIDTRAALAAPNVIVWAGKAPRAGSHVVRIVNQATVGRPRIDLDAVLTNF